MGLDVEQLYRPIPMHLNTDYFHPAASPLDINRWLEAAREYIKNENFYQGVFYRFSQKVFDPSLPSIGIYGKVGITKGSFDLVRALGKLKAQHVQFNFLAVTQGNSPTFFDFIRAIEENDLADETWLLPFIPHWRIPNLIKSCAAVCFLERDFPIKHHIPSIPREVFACGGCLVLSEQIAKQFVYTPFKDSSNVFLVNPQDTDSLALRLRILLENSDLRTSIGTKGFIELSKDRENFAKDADSLATTFQQIIHESQKRRKIMSLGEMQAYLALLYTDGAFRQLSNLSPESTFESYKLTEQEIAAIKGIDRKMLEVFAASLKSKRKSFIESGYKILFQLIPPEMERYYDRYYQLYKARPNESTLNQVLEFGHFLEASLSADDEVPPYTPDIAKFERLFYAAAFSPNRRDALETFNTPDEKSAQVSMDSSPNLVEGVQVASFTYNVVAIIEDLDKNRLPHSPKEGEYIFVFKQIRDSLQPEVFGISKATSVLLDLCDGKTTLSQLVESLEERLQRNNLREGIIHIVQQLVDMMLLEV